MKHHVPRSPLAMALSGSAKEVELRIRNIVQGPKKRPPIPLMVLAAVAILSCGWLVSCQPTEPAEADRLTNTRLLTLVENIPERYSTEPIGPLLDDLTADQLPTVPVDLARLDQSENWRELVWLLSQDEASDTALYGVLQFDQYQPGLSQADRMYGVILRHGEDWSFYDLNWQTTFWSQQAPELWVEDFDHDGQQEAAFVLAWDRGSGGRHLESLFICPFDTPQYITPYLNPSGQSGGTFTAQYDPMSCILTLSAGNQQTAVDESSVSEALVEEAVLLAQDYVRYSCLDGTLWCTLGFRPSHAPMSDLIPVDYPLVFQGGSCLLGQPHLPSSMTG